MPLWTLGLIIIALSTAYHVLIIADQQENKAIRQTGYLISVIGIAAILVSVIIKLYYTLDALCKL